ncbi:hypothetical protein BC829DRAFT_424059 [Chytridium lagenaria]|nr:hypothetical protein BC829DRAFT_424059 [Chytridium lagenaria]
MAPIISALQQQLEFGLFSMVMDDSVKLRVALVGYRDFDAPERYTIMDFITSDHIANHLATIQTDSGPYPDTCEDVLGGMYHCGRLSWMARYRLLLHFGDAPPHGQRFHDWTYENSDHWRINPPPEHPPESAEIYIETLCKLNVQTVFFQLGKPEWTNKMLDVFSTIYRSLGRDAFFETVSLGEMSSPRFEDWFFECLFETIKVMVGRMGLVRG